MHARKIVGYTAVLAVSASMAALLLWPHAKRRPPVLRIVRTEPAGIMDDAGNEMLLATLSVSNSETLPPSQRNAVYVKDGTGGIQVGFPAQMESPKAFLGPLAVPPGYSQEKLILIARTGDFCYLRVNYASAQLLKGRCYVLAGRLPLSVRRRLPHAFWRWAGYSYYGPRDDWQEITVQVAVPNQ